MHPPCLMFLVLLPFVFLGHKTRKKERKDRSLSVGVLSMCSTMRPCSLTLLLVALSLLLSFPPFCSGSAASPGSAEGFTINGRVKIPGLAVQAFGVSGKPSDAKVRVDVSARHPGKVQAALTETRRSLSELVLEPLREEQYYEIREPFSIMSVVKSPMGLMVGFMLIVMFLMPKLVENMDPEEMRRAQEEMRSQGVPSLASLLPGAARQ
ncbi:hypothetical protein MLD38_006127 [Melastoma candidum]|uniref:Uncharacterized protein n=1 Tax=Melastoma candidum TaxID=119954 RepID=A0ACB9RNT9_9MYRT|nr:hypothetical protein MLD38_006127 [Melastoma candidum]